MRKIPAVTCRIALVLVLLITWSALPVRAQEVTVLDAHVLSRALTAWLEAVSTHRPGAADAAAQHAAGLTDTDLREVLRELDDTVRILQRAATRNRAIPVRGTGLDGRLMPSRDTRALLGLSHDPLEAADFRPAIERAVLLHTDTAVHLYERHPAVLTTAAPSDGAGSVLVRDGQPVGSTVRWPHWHVARQLVARLPEVHASPRGEEWYVAVAAYMYAHLNLMDLVPHMREALRLFPASPAVLFQGGLMHALMASPTVQQGAQRTPVPQDQTLDVVAARTHLRQARSLLSRSLEADPTLVEVRVRLAGILLAMSEAAQARRHVQEALGAPLDPALRYYAEMFLGDAWAAGGDHQAAAAAYHRAAALFPDAQSPWFALSWINRADGRQADAMQMLDRALVDSVGRQESSDPWWNYHRRHTDDPEQLLDAWRGTVSDRSERP